MSSDFAIHRRSVGDALVVEVHGELDVLTRDTFRACASAATRACPAVVVDLSGTTLLDCAGLSALVAAQREARRDGGELSTAGVRGLVRLLFDAFGMGCALGGGDLDEELRRVRRARRQTGSRCGSRSVTARAS